MKENVEIYFNCVLEFERSFLNYHDYCSLKQWKEFLFYLKGIKLFWIKNIRIYRTSFPFIMMYLFSCSYNTLKTFMQDGDSKVDLGAGKHTLAASGAGECHVQDVLTDSQGGGHFKPAL
jgi:hypothetical protein